MSYYNPRSGVPVWGFLFIRSKMVKLVLNYLKVIVFPTIDIFLKLAPGA